MARFARPVTSEPTERWKRSVRISMYVSITCRHPDISTQTWVHGIEADPQTSRKKNSNRFVDSFSLSDHADNQTMLDGTTVTDHEGKISWYGTVRGRLGYPLNDALLYGTGGLAYGKV